MHKIMARYKHLDMSQSLLPVVLEDQLVLGSFAHAVHHLVDQLDLSRFDTYYRNDKIGCCSPRLRVRDGNTVNFAEQSKVATQSEMVSSDNAAIRNPVKL